MARSPRRIAYRQVTITDSRGKVLVYAEKLAIDATRRGDGTLGLHGITFAPGVVGRLVSSPVSDIVVASQGIPRLRLGGFRLSLGSGEEPLSTGECAYAAAIGAFRSAVPIPRRARGGNS